MLVVSHFTQMLKEMLKQLCRGLLHKDTQLWQELYFADYIFGALKHL